MVNGILQVDGIRKTFSTGQASRLAREPFEIADVSFTVNRGMTLGIVGQSGSGKTTIARIIAGLLAPDAGRVMFDGIDLTGMRDRERRSIRRRLQLVFQDPSAVLDPWLTVEQLLLEGLRAHRLGDRASRLDLVHETLDEIGIPPELRTARPRTLSGGQRQRVAIARSLVLRPELIVLDEPVSALDVSIQRQILDLLIALREHHGVTYVVILHDLAVAAQICSDILVMRRGRIVESGSPEQVFADPKHPYTRELIAAVPVFPYPRYSAASNQRDEERT
jgi:peptide/nickel transport system ATP-binding protein